jgi:hypothetical protein
VAGIGVEFAMQDWGGKSSKKAMKALHIISNGEISQEAQREYAALFKHPLSPSQVKALAALFGWSIPAELEI